jgi:hypothetical protein
VLVALPPAFSLPQRVATSAVRVGGKAARSISVSRETHTIRIALPPLHGISCYSIAPGSVTVAFAKAANLGNPARPGRYRITVTAGRQQTVDSLTIR